MQNNNLSEQKRNWKAVLKKVAIVVGVLILINGVLLIAQELYAGKYQKESVELEAWLETTQTELVVKENLLDSFENDLTGLEQGLDACNVDCQAKQDEYDILYNEYEALYNEYAILVDLYDEKVNRYNEVIDKAESRWYIIPLGF